MFKSAIEWVVWTIVGLVLLGAFVLHYAGLWSLPDYILFVDAYCLGMFSLLYFGAIAQAIKRK